MIEVWATDTDDAEAGFEYDEAPRFSLEYRTYLALARLTRHRVGSCCVASLRVGLLAGCAAAAWLGLSSQRGRLQLHVMDQANSLSEVQQLQCSGAGVDCSSTRCCVDSDNLCFQRDASYAECRRSCLVGTHGGHAASVGHWTCHILRVGKEPPTALTPAAPPALNPPPATNTPQGAPPRTGRPSTSSVGIPVAGTAPRAVPATTVHPAAAAAAPPPTTPSTTPPPGPSVGPATVPPMGGQTPVPVGAGHPQTVAATAAHVGPARPTQAAGPVAPPTTSPGSPSTGALQGPAGKPRVPPAVAPSPLQRPAGAAAATPPATATAAPVIHPPAVAAPPAAAAGAAGHVEPAGHTPKPQDPVVLSHIPQTTPLPAVGGAAAAAAAAAPRTTPPPAVPARPVTAAPPPAAPLPAVPARPPSAAPGKPAVPPQGAAAGANPGVTRAPATPPAAHPPGGHPSCSPAKGNCKLTKCCQNATMRCYEKNPTWSACLERCAPGVHLEDPPEHQSPWSCHAHPPAALAAAAAAAAAAGGPKLFCFAICTSKGSDFDLMRSQAPKQAGIFGCNAYQIFSDKELDLPKTTVLPQVVSRKGVAGALTATWVNAEAFISVWDHILTENAFASHDWVVKVDPDCVFVPSRLKLHLRQPHFEGPGKAPTGAYLKNCAAGPRGLQLFGSIEVLSRNAVVTMRGQWNRCKTEIDHSQMGEDMWLQKSLDLIHAQPLEDYSHLVDDGYCPGLPSPDVCSIGFVAFHPLKLPDQWLRCWDEANN